MDGLALGYSHMHTCTNSHPLASLTRAKTTLLRENRLTLEFVTIKQGSCVSFFKMKLSGLGSVRLDLIHFYLINPIQGSKHLVNTYYMPRMGLHSQGRQREITFVVQPAHAVKLPNIICILIKPAIP